MATHDYIISNASGAAVRADLNNALAAIASNNSSATEPATTYAYQWWADTGSSPTVMKLRNAANSAWITLFQLDGEWNLLPVENGTAAAPSIYFKDSGTDTGIYSPGTDQVGISAGGTSRFEISTSATTSTLPVVHPLGAVATPSITFTGDLNTGIWSPAADTIAFSEGGTEAMRIDSSGRLLVGTSSTSAAATLVLQGNSVSSADGALILLQSGQSASSIGASTGTNVGYIRFADNAGGKFAEIVAQSDAAAGTNDFPGRLVFSTTADGASSPTERMRIFSNGNVNFFGGLGIGLGSNVTNNQGSTITVSSNVLGSGAGTHFIKWSNATGVLTFDTSSRLVKEEIVDCPYGIDALKLLQPRKYFRTDDQREEIGFIADEVVQVMPEVVPLGPKSLLTKNEEDAEEIPVGVNYDRLTAVLTKALQEAIAKIETLEAKVAALEAAGIN